MQLFKNKRSGQVYEVRNIATYSVTFIEPNKQYPQEIYENIERFKTDYEPFHESDAHD